MISNKIKLISVIFIIGVYISSIIVSIPSIPYFSIENEYKSEELEYQITTVHDKSNEYKIIHYYDGQELAGSIITQDNSILLNENKLDEIFYAEIVANLAKDEDLENKYRQSLNNLEILENKSKATHDLILSTALFSALLVVGSSEISVASIPITVGKETIIKSFEIKDILPKIKNMLEKDYNFETAKNNLQKAVFLSQRLKYYHIELDDASNLQKQNQKIITDLSLIDNDVSLKITEEFYTNIGQLSIDFGNFLISCSESGLIDLFDTENKLQKSGNEFVEYGQSWKSDFEEFNENYDYIKNLNSTFVDCDKSAKIQSDDSIMFVSERNDIAKNKIAKVERNIKTISLSSKLKSRHEWIETEYYIFLAKYIHKNRPLTIEYLCNEADKNIEYMRYR